MADIDNISDKTHQQRRWDKYLTIASTDFNDPNGRAEFLATAEMLDEIHAMLRHLIAQQPTRDQ